MDEAELLFSPEALLYEDFSLLPISLSVFFLPHPISSGGGGLGARVKARRGRGPFLGAPEGHSPAPDFHNPSGARSKLLTSEL